VGVASEGIWRRFCHVIERPELADDARFAKNPERVEHRAELISVLTDLFLERDTSTWITLLGDAGIPCAPVQTIDQVFGSPQVQHREMLVQVQHPTAGTLPMAGLPVKLSATPASIRLAPPLLGQHSEEVLQAWLGMDEDAVANLKSAGVIGSFSGPEGFEHKV
jgi:crotonobetainyl-CoA:carnitine CoA-transferase CaiB-like acyl-CoA transferase